MPAPATHYIFALSLENKVRALDPQMRFSSPAFFFGTQGPDFLFSHRIWREAWKGENLIWLGVELHNGCPSKEFGLMREYLENFPCDKDLIKSYIYGFIAHYSLDRMAHPLIYAIQKELTAAHSLESYGSLVVHNQIEMNIDSILAESELGYHKGTDLKIYNGLNTDRHLVDEMAALMKYTVSGLGHPEVKKDELANAYRHMHLGQVFAGDNTGARRKVIKLIEKPLYGVLGGPLLSSFVRPVHTDNAWDYLNSAHKEWSLICDDSVKSTKSFLDLYYEAQDDTMQLIEAFNSSDKNAFKEYSKDLSYNTGLRYDINTSY